MPSYSWKPMICSTFVFVLVVGLLLNTFMPGNYLWLVSVAGAVGMIGSVWAWVSEPV